MERKTSKFWDVMFFSISTDPERIAYVRNMYDRDELEVGVNIPRERTFDREHIDLPEVVVTGRTDSTLSCRAFYEGEEDAALDFTLDLDGSPAIDIQIGSEEEPAWIGLEIINADDPIDLSDIDDVPDDDGRYDAWA